MVYRESMKRISLLLVVPLLLAACSGQGGPAQRAGASVDHAMYKVGEGISTVGKKIEASANQ